MKWWTSLFALYLLTISCMPCICADDICDSNAASTQQPAPIEKKAPDYCTPFCSCHAAFGQEATQWMPNNPLTPMAKNSFGWCQQQFIFYNYSNIWQPPRLS